MSRGGGSGTFRKVVEVRQNFLNSPDDFLFFAGVDQKARVAVVDGVRDARVTRADGGNSKMVGFQDGDAKAFKISAGLGFAQEDKYVGMLQMIQIFGVRDGAVESDVMLQTPFLEAGRQASGCCRRPRQW